MLHISRMEADSANSINVKMWHSLSLPERGWKGAVLPVSKVFILHYGKRKEPNFVEKSESRKEKKNVQDQLFSFKQNVDKIQIR